MKQALTIKCAFRPLILYSIFDNKFGFFWLPEPGIEIYSVVAPHLMYFFSSLFHFLPLFTFFLIFMRAFFGFLSIIFFHLRLERINILTWPRRFSQMTPLFFSPPSSRNKYSSRVAVTSDSVLISTMIFPKFQKGRTALSNQSHAKPRFLFSFFLFFLLNREWFSKRHLFSNKLEQILT